MNNLTQRSDENHGKDGGKERQKRKAEKKGRKGAFIENITRMAEKQKGL